MQRKLQELMHDNFSALQSGEQPDARAALIRDNMLALHDELHEALGEVGWKPWATDRRVNREAFISEMADAYHFFLNLLLLINCSGDEFDQAWRRKNEKNWYRYKNADYDGVSTKCPVCARDVNDAGVLCRVPSTTEGTGRCDPNNAVYTYKQFLEMRAS